MRWRCWSTLLLAASTGCVPLADADDGAAGDAGSDADAPADTDTDADADADTDADADADADSDADTDTGEVPAEDPLAALSDTFETDALASWTFLQPDLFTAAVADGALAITPITRTLWFDDSVGPALVKVVDGDFVATATVHAVQASDPSMPVSGAWQMAGLMARDPAEDGAEDYVFTVVGDDGALSQEWKTTEGGASLYASVPWGTGDAELRICRIGATFGLYHRVPADGPWTLLTEIERPDLPASLEVGPVTYGNTDAFDIVGRFDEVVFASVAGPSGCTAP